jgi:hypothetical protein
MATRTDNCRPLGFPWLNALVVLNFLLFSFGVRYSALGTAPDEQGFVLRERLQLITVTESVWLLNLFYTYISWLSPLGMVVYAIVWQNDRLGSFSLHRSVRERSRSKSNVPLIGLLSFYFTAAVTTTLGVFSLTSKLIASLSNWYSM